MKRAVLHYPRLDTILKVESVLKTAGTPISKNEIDRRLAKKIMRSTLNLILKYLVESNKIEIQKEGISWIFVEHTKEEGANE